MMRLGYEKSIHTVLFRCLLTSLTIVSGRKTEMLYTLLHTYLAGTER